MNSRAALALYLALLGACADGSSSSGDADAGPQVTFASAANEAAAALQQYLYSAPGEWNACVPGQCFADDFDWGADSLTDSLYLRWLQSSDPQIVPWMQALAATGDTWPPCVAPFCLAWSDVPMWDAIAAIRVYQVTQDPAALARAQSNFDTVDGSSAFALGACPSIDYQQPSGGPNLLKTLESDSNYVKAALLLYEQTQQSRYLQRAITKYQAIRQYFLDPEVPLYSVFVFDDGVVCTQVPHRFFASVNGNMIWAGLHLFEDAHGSSYLADAIATATAVAQRLDDSSGLFVDLEDDDDVVEPLVEAMYELASGQGQAFARTWILTNAAASRAARSSEGVYGRFFNGPPPVAMVTEWQANGGFALAFAAAALAPTTTFAADGFWTGATVVTTDLSDPPFSLSFTGRGIALFGTLGEVCCGLGHARVFVDGVETYDETGICQNESPATGSGGIPSFATSLPGSILFAWRWPTSGPYTLSFEPGIENAKEGGSFLHLQGYSVAP